MDWMGIIGCVFLAISIVINVVMVVQDYRKHARIMKEVRKREKFSANMNNAAKSFMESPEWEELINMANEPDEEEQDDFPVIPREYVGSFEATFVDDGRKSMPSAFDEIDIPEQVVSELEVDIVDGGSTEFIPADPLNQTPFEQAVLQARNGS